MITSAVQGSNIIMSRAKLRTRVKLHTLNAIVIWRREPAFNWHKEERQLSMWFLVFAEYESEEATYRAHWHVYHSG